MATYSSILAWRIPMDRGAWRATVHGVAKSQTRLSTAQLILEVPRPAASISFLDMQIFRPQPSLLNQKLLRMGPHICVLRPLGSCDAHSSLRVIR